MVCIIKLVCLHFCLLDGLDLIIVPGLGFTVDGRRLGRGQGFYDGYITNYKKKFFSNNLKTIGLAFTEQIYKDIPVHIKDIPIDFVLHRYYDHPDYHNK